MKTTLQLPFQLKGFLELGDAVLITDSNHIILDVNDTYQKVTGFEKSKIIGVKAGFIKSNLTNKETYCSMKDSLKQQIPWSGIFVNRKKSGELWHSSITITPFKIASILHDIGKAGMPEGILYKPGALSIYERKIIEMHPLTGADILNKMSKEINYDFIKSMEVAENIILYHHEKWDGTGYPFQLKGEQIPLEARVVSIVDVLFDALTTCRPYKDSWPEGKALAFIDENKGKHFDPLIAETFISLF
ncbi:HD domain-containing phosphohydrolase [Solibacillus sp. FSL K6-1554]|uniref:HD domain-containing phosphohydrolase n=1 Tax=Solibacillus sp. FSL K6-1554 TaxID=2921472 RepID=UPI0030F82297